MRTLVASIVCLLTLGLCHANVAIAGGAGPIRPWIESGDAGSLSAPQHLVGASIDGIKGSIGGSDTVDVFAFHWAGGALGFATESIGPLFLSVWNLAGTTQLSGESPGLLPVDALGEGDYLLKIATSLGLPDPPYTVEVFTFTPFEGESFPRPAFVSTPSVDAPSGISWPAGIWLIGSALGGLGALARARRRA